MRRFFFGLAAAIAGCMPVSGQAAPFTAVYTGVVSDTQTPFSATFFYDSDALVQAKDDPSLFNGTGGLQTATFSSAGQTFLLNASGYFYERVVSGTMPNYEFGIGQDDGSFLFLKLNGAVQEGNYALADGSYADLDPSRVDIGPTISPVPLPSGFALFAGSLLALGIAGYGSGRGKARSVPARRATAGSIG